MKIFNNIENKEMNKELDRVFWRSFQMEFAWNYERQMNLGYVYAMIPVLKKIYANDKEGLKKALKRHLEFFNMTPHIVTLMLGISSAMEKENSESENFDENSIKTLLENKYQVTKDADRMGMRLSGEVIKHKDKADIISDAAVFGSIQVPGNGQPIILLADRQTTGGYTKIATVIKADLPKLAQMVPNDTIEFSLVNIEEAQKEYKEFYKILDEIKESFVVKPKVYTEKQLYVIKKLFGNRRK